MEVWKDVKGYEGLYYVSSTGRVRSSYRDGILAGTSSGTGYRKVQLWKDGHGRKFFVHRLVAEAFLPNVDGLPEVNHIDGVRDNNCVENLEWVDYSGNTRHAVYNKFLCPWGNPAKKVEAIYPDGRVVLFNTLSEAERFFGSRHIVDVLKGRRNMCKGCSFRYAEGGDANAVSEN